MKKTIKCILKAVVALLLILFVAAGSYLAYYFISSRRIEDHQSLSVKSGETAEETVATDEAYTIITYNLGFGAYSDTFGFFLDGGTESRAFSKDAVYANIGGALNTVQKLEPDFCMFQEVDLNGTRSYQVNECDLVTEALPLFDSVSAVSYDSPYLIYPFTQPHGKNLSQMMTLSAVSIQNAERRSLPIDKGLSRVLDLDRCFSVSEVNVAGCRMLYLYNVHFSAYSGEADTVKQQIITMAQDIESRCGQDDYIIIGGDFNQDVLADGSSSVFGTDGSYSWTNPFLTEILPVFCTLVQPTETPIIPSCRLADGPYVAGESFVISVDGFIVSDNIEVMYLSAVDTGFLYSDHNPVEMHFKCKAPTSES